MSSYVSAALSLVSSISLLIQQKNVCQILEKFIHAFWNIFLLFKSILRTLYAYAFYVCFKSLNFVSNRFGRECLIQPRATKVTILMEIPSTAQPHQRCIQMILDVLQCTRQACNMTTRTLSVVKVHPGQSLLVRSISTWVIPKKTTLIYLPVRPIVVDRVVALDGSPLAKESPRLHHRLQNVSFRKAGLLEEGRISDKLPKFFDG